MGFFSKNCAKTHLPVLAHLAWHKDAPRLTSIVVLLPGQEPYPALYDGYGLHLDNYDDAKFVLASDYAGETYAALGPSHDEPNQGFFHDREFIHALSTLKGFASFDAYENALDDYSFGAEEIANQLLRELGCTDEEKVLYRAAMAFRYAGDGDEREAMSYAAKSPWLSGVGFDELKARAMPFVEKLNEQTQALAVKVCAERGLSG